MWVKEKFTGKQKASEPMDLPSLVRKEGWSPAACEIVCPTDAVVPWVLGSMLFGVQVVPVLATRQHRLAEKVQQISFISLDGLTERRGFRNTKVFHLFLKVPFPPGCKQTTCCALLCFVELSNHDTYFFSIIRLHWANFSFALSFLILNPILKAMLHNSGAQDLDCLDPWILQTYIKWIFLCRFL